MITSYMPLSKVSIIKDDCMIPVDKAILMIEREGLSWADFVKNVSIRYVIPENIRCVFLSDVNEYIGVNNES